MTIAGYMVDCSNPGQSNLTGQSAIPAVDVHLPRGTAFYLGGDTPHVWTLAQFKAQTNPYRLPLWVANPNKLTAAQGAADGRAAAAAALDVFKMPVHQALMIGLDMETWQSVAYSRAFRDAVVAAGYWYTPYGSWSSVRGNYVGTCGYFSADWTDAAHVDPDCWATQYASDTQLGKPFDLSAVASWAHVWNVSTPAPKPVPGWQVGVVDDLGKVVADLQRVAAVVASHE
jgi:hypothetical protein